MGHARLKNERYSLVLALLWLATGIWVPGPSESATGPVDGQKCNMNAAELPLEWSEAETWAWDQICKGLVADFDLKLGTTKASGRQTDDRFDDPRRALGPGWLRIVLTRQPFRSAIPPEGIRIHGAVFNEDVDVRDAALTHVVGINDAMFRKGVMMNRLRTSTSLSFAGSKFAGDLWLDSAKIGGGLRMANGEFGHVVLKTAEITGDFGISRSRVSGKLNMNGASVGGTVFLKDGMFKEVDLTNAFAGRQVNMKGSAFTGSVELGGMSVGGHLLMDDGARFGEVILRSAQVRGDLDMSGSVFGDGIEGQSMTIGQNLQLVDTMIKGMTDISAISVAGSVDIGGATLSALNLSGAVIGKDLMIGAGGRTVHWLGSAAIDGRAGTSWIILSDVSAARLVDDAASWPESLGMFLGDFRYERLMPIDGAREGLRRLRSSAWYVNWLARDRSDSFQPYWQLAQVLTGYGESGKANDVLIAGRERKRMQLPWDEPYRWWLWFLYWTIGYGYGAGELFALVLAIPFVAAGTLIAWRFGEPWPDGERPGFWYSVDMLLPGIQLSERHRETELAGRPKHYFRVHRIIGYFLLFFFLSGLTGLAEWAG